MTTAEARYSHTNRDHNRLLLLALTEAWGNKCYWCRKPKTFRELQIDHIVPRNPRGGSSQDFDVDDVANLAPICGPCNQEKGNSEFDDAPRVDAIREAAAGRAPNVARNLATFRKDGTVVKALLAVTAADLGSDDVAESVEAFGSLILPVFRDKFPHILNAPYSEDFSVRRRPVEYRGRMIKLPDEVTTVDFDAQSHRARIILEDVLELSLRWVLDHIREYFADDLDRDVDEWLRGSRRIFTSVTLTERPSSNPVALYVYELRHEDGAVTLTGELEGSFIADIEEDDDDYFASGSTRRRSVDFDFIGSFSATFEREGLMDAWVHIGDPSESEWRRHARILQLESDASSQDSTP
ncbi:HNH endonuclease [Gordonia sp. DT101]|uniref:HNH endonuclease n=1 Tax=Gordonia sp. DT101 TaxID=3416545 RepID=UPI003CEE3AF5